MSIFRGTIVGIVRQHLMNPKYKAQLKEIFDNLGLNPQETGTMLFLLENSVGLRVTEIAKRTGANRTTLYGTLNSLVDKGLVSTSEERGVMRFQSIQPHLLVDYVERAKDKLASDSKRLNQLVPEIVQARKARGEEYPQIQFFGGIEGIKQVYEDTLHDSKEMFGFINYEAALNLMGREWANRYIQKRVAAGVTAYTISSDSTKAKDMKSQDDRHKRVIKVFPKGYEFDLEIMAYGEKVALISFDAKHPLAVIIKDGEIARTVKTLFRYIDSTLTA